jgi:hypothetical protein
VGGTALSLPKQVFLLHGSIEKVDCLIVANSGQFPDDTISDTRVCFEIFEGDSETPNILALSQFEVRSVGILFNHEECTALSF